MVTDEERLVVTLEARVRDFEKSFARAQQTSDRRLKAIESRARTSATRLQGTFSQVGERANLALATIGRGWAGIAALGTGGALTAIRSAVRDLAETAAEAQRAGVDLGSFQELSYGARRAKVGIDALTDGLKEMQLRADEFIVTGAGGGAEAFQRLGYGAEELRKKLEDPAALFEEIIEKLGRLDKAAQIRISDEVFGGAGGEQFLRIIERGAGWLSTQRTEARLTGNVLDEEIFKRAQEIDQKFIDITTTIGNRMKAAIVAVSGALTSFIGALSSVDRPLSSLSDADLQRIANPTRQRHGSRGQAIGAPDSVTYPQFVSGSRGQQVTNPDWQRQQDAIAELDRRAKVATAAAGPSGLGDLSKISTPAKAAADQLKEAYAGIVMSAEQRIQQMVTEQQALGLTTAEAEKLRVKQELLAEVQRAGITLTTEQARQLDELAARSGEAAQALEDQARAQADLINSMDTVRGTSYDVLSGFSQDLRAGISLTDSLNNALNRVLDTIIDISLQNAIKGLFGASGTTETGSLGGLLSSFFGGFKAEGGPISAGKGYIVGERGPEFIVPRASGFVIPNHALGGGGGSNYSLTVINQMPGAEVEAGPRRPDGRGGVSQELVIRRAVRAEMQAAIREGHLDAAAGWRWGVRRHDLG